MPNIKKSDDERKTRHLRIPVSRPQHEKIMAAAGEAGMAAWARGILLAAADEAIAVKTHPKRKAGK